jgi:uncharacterized protein (DUF1501 family)
MKRRNFIKNVSLASVSTPFIFNGKTLNAIEKNLFTVPKSFEDRILIVIRLNGGNDGLNTIIPIDQYDNLMIQREAIIIPENEIINVADNNGFHPAMNGMANLYNEGKIGIIQNVGYPQQNRSHFRSMDIWTRGLMDPSLNTGWLGRYFNLEHPNYPNGYPNDDHTDPFAINMGFEVSATCQGMLSNFSHALLDPTVAAVLPNSGGINDGSYYGEHIEFLTGIINQTNVFGANIKDAYDAGNNLSTLYDENNRLAEQLKQVARLISGGLKTKVYVLNVNGFDTHDNQIIQTDTTSGIHANLLKTVSDAVAAFQDDITRLGHADRVVGMTFSEFGRQTAANGSFGTDHGDAAPLILFGDCINHGFYGPNPEIPDQITSQAGIPMQIDFRDVYASIIKDWFMVEENEVRSLFEHNVTFHNIVGNCSLDTQEQIKEDAIKAIVYPNPCGSSTTLKLEGKGEYVSISVINLQGQKVKTAFEGTLTPSTHHLPIDLDGIKSGNYRVVIISPNGKESVSLLKL